MIMIALLIPVAFMLGVGIGGYISGHVGYEEGIQDERRKWYIHAQCYGWKEEDFKED